MRSVRKIRGVFKSTPTIEGAGVHLKRAFGSAETPQFDPFLLFDDFHSNKPRDYMKGFPWHPHRGIETITYILHGNVEHGDSMHNKGVIHPGEVQWMTAGSGIIHQEMPKGERSGLLWGFQLWANLPSSHKMMQPRYRDIRADQIPTVILKDGITVRVISGKVNGAIGPVRDIVIDPEYLDITIPPGRELLHPVKPSHSVFAYLIDGNGHFGPDDDTVIECETAVLFDDGERVRAAAKDVPVRVLLISGKPLKEPVAWYGPIVMNTQEELDRAFEEYRNGTFIKLT